MDIFLFKSGGYLSFDSIVLKTKLIQVKSFHAGDLKYFV